MRPVESLLLSDIKKVIKIGKFYEAREVRNIPVM